MMKETLLTAIVSLPLLIGCGRDDKPPASTLVGREEPTQNKAPVIGDVVYEGGKYLVGVTDDITEGVEAYMFFNGRVTTLKPYANLKSEDGAVYFIIPNEVLKRVVSSKSATGTNYDFTTKFEIWAVDRRDLSSEKTNIFSSFDYFDR